MAATKYFQNIWSGQNLSAGAQNTTGSWFNLSSGYGAQLDIRLTNTGAATSGAQVVIQVANNWNVGIPSLPSEYGGAFVGGSGIGIYYASVELPIGIQATRLIAGSNVGQNVTVDADISQVTII